MNHLLADNKVNTLRAYLHGKLSARYGEREARNLVHALFDEFHGWSRTELVLRSNDRLGESELLRYHFALKRMMQGEPLQYVLGNGWFMGMKLRTTPAALIPRPETEELVRLVLERNTHTAPAILDVGTGSGCIAIALKKHLPEASLTAIDISEEAIMLAENNAKSLEVNIHFEVIDILKNNNLDEFDIIVSNPPYIPVSEAATMANHVTEHEPHLALFTENDDPLVFYRRLMELTSTMLRPGGFVCCEIHENLADELLQIAQHYPIQIPEIHRDLQAKNRMIFWRAQ